jgi:signal transduction histidine kinase
VTRTADYEHRREQWIAWVRVLALGWAVAEVAYVVHDYPPGHRTAGWIATAVLGAGAVVLLWLARRRWGDRGRTVLGAAALVFDVAITYAFVFIFAFEPGSPVSRLVVLVVIEAAVRYGVAGGLVLTAANVPILVAVEVWRSQNFAPETFELRNVSLALGIQLLAGLIVGGLVRQLGEEAREAEARAGEAEALRDEIGRHADQLELVNRAARALSSSLDLNESWDRFVREVRAGLAFDRIALVLADGPKAIVIADAGLGEEGAGRSDWSRPLDETALADVLRDGATVVTPDIAERPRYPEEAEIAALGLRSRVLAPLAVAGRALGGLSVSRVEPGGFTREEVDLVTLLGRQVGTAVENIRAFETERLAAEELRRLSALRADFVSLVSHELRGPMASVIGCASTLRQRWRTLSPDQRESFLALIDEETTRLAELVGDVLDTSRLEAGTFTYAFDDVDVAELVREVAAVVDLGAEDVSVSANVSGALPPVRGDRERLRQLVMNLLTNAVKYTVAGDEIDVRAYADDGAVLVSVSDNGPGISADEQRLIFEKFGRAAAASGSKPGAGLGLFIARSIAEAHGGTIVVASERGSGATFTVRLPVGTG